MSVTDYGDAQFGGRTRMTGWRGFYSRISWGAVFAGSVVAAATMLMLGFLGIGIGAGALQFSQTSVSDLRGYGLGAGIWTAINLILSMLFGGYVAARLSGTHSHLDGELHGITMWGVATLLATWLLGQLASFAVGTVTTTAGAVATGSSALTQQVNPQSLVDRLQQTLTSNGDPTQMTRPQIRSEIAALTGRLLLSNGSLTDQEQSRLTALVAADANVTPEEAARRVARMEQNATAALAQARTAADSAAAGASLGAKAFFSALLLGLGAAMLGAWFGTRHARVLAPLHEPVYETHPATFATAPVYHPVHETVVTAPQSVHVFDETTRPVPAYLRDVTFPASKQDLLRLARARNEEPITLRRLEQVPDRSYSSVNDLMSALFATA